MWGDHKRGRQEKAALASFSFNRSPGPAMLQYSLDLCSPFNTIHGVNFSLSVLKGEEEEKNHIPGIWHKKLPQQGGKKRLVTTQFKTTHPFWLQSVSGVDPSLSPHPLGLKAQSTWHSSGEAKQLQGNERDRSWWGKKMEGSAKWSQHKEGMEVFCSWGPSHTDESSWCSCYWAQSKQVKCLLCPQLGVLHCV